VERKHLEYRITDDQRLLDFSTLHHWLTSSYWSPGISRENVEKAAKYSALVVSAWRDEKPNPCQVGYCRVVSDRTRFAWLADVYVDPDHRGHGLGRAIIQFALDHPDLAGVGNWLLGTLDAHGVYAALGFAPPAEPHRLMQLKRPV